MNATCAFCLKAIPFYQTDGTERFVKHRVEGDGWFYLPRNGWTVCRGSMRTPDEAKALRAESDPWVGWRVEVDLFFLTLGEQQAYRTIDYVEAPTESWAKTLYRDRRSEKDARIVSVTQQEYALHCLEQALTSGRMGSRERWKEVQATGADDEQLLDIIRDVWASPAASNRGGMYGPDLAYNWSGGRAPHLNALRPLGDVNEPPLTVIYGQELVDSARRLMGVPNPDPEVKIRPYKLPREKGQKVKVYPAPVEENPEIPFWDLYALPTGPGRGFPVFRCPLCSHRVTAYGGSSLVMHAHNAKGEMFGAEEACLGSGRSLRIAHLIAHRQMDALDEHTVTEMFLHAIEQTMLLTPLEGVTTEDIRGFFRRWGHRLASTVRPRAPEIRALMTG